MNLRVPILIATLAIIFTGQVKALGIVGSNFTIDLYQDGPDVVATGSGSIDTDALTPSSGGMYSPFMYPAFAGIYVGPLNTPFDDYTGITGPTSFGPGTGTNSFATSGSGDFVGTDNAVIIVPSGYVSGTPLSNTATWSNQTFSSLGVTPGTYTWTWNGGLDTFTLVAVPEPSQYGVFIFLAVAGFIGWKRFQIRPALACR